MDREYFCLVNIEIPVPGGVEKSIREVELNVDPDKTDARGLYHLARDEVQRHLRRYEDVSPDDVVFTGFNFWPMNLPR